MGLEKVVDDVLVWDDSENKMVHKKEVFAVVRGNKGSVFMEEGPIVCYPDDVELVFETLADRIYYKIAHFDNGDRVW